MNIVGNYKIYSEERMGLKKKPVQVWVAQHINNEEDSHWMVTYALIAVLAQRATTDCTKLITWK